MITPHGKLVNVNGRNMHIRQIGAHGKTIVLMPGWGVPLPTVEFAPLMRALSEKHTVCTIEFFGYGHSDSTDRPHTNENYVQEIREALKMAGLKPPYVLMPYSCSGIYSEYYAAKYPEEVEGLILLDCAPTIEGYAQKLVITQEDIDELNSTDEPATFSEDDYEEAVAEYTEHGCTRDEVLEIVKSIESLGCMDTQIAQYAALSQNVREVMSMRIPTDIPVLVLSSDLRKQLDAGEELKEYEKYLKDYMEKLGECARLVIVQGSTHSDIYYHREYRKIICEAVEQFLRFL